MKHDFNDGKYTVSFEDGHIHALRYGEPWRELAADGMVLAMLHDYDAQRTMLARAVLCLGEAVEFINGFVGDTAQDPSIDPLFEKISQLLGEIPVMPEEELLLAGVKQ